MTALTKAILLTHIRRLPQLRSKYQSIKSVNCATLNSRPTVALLLSPTKSIPQSSCWAAGSFCYRFLTSQETPWPFI